MKAHIENGVEEINESNSSPKRALETSTSGEAGGTTREIRLANVRAKVKALSSGKSFRAFDAITDLIAEARINKASLLDTRRGALELVKLLALPTGQRRATTYRDLCELGRNLHLPSWHGSERRHLYVWYHCLQRMRLVEVEAGQVLMKQGDVADTTYWLLHGTMEEYRMGPPQSLSPPRSPVRMSLLRARSMTLDRLKSVGDGRAVPAAAVAENSPRISTAGGGGGSGGGGGAENPLAPSPSLVAVATAAVPSTGSESPSRVRKHVTDSGGVGAEAIPSFPSGEVTPLAPLASVRSVAKKVKVFERLGQEALQGNAYTVNVEASTPCQLAALSRADYQAVVALAARESFEGLRAMSSLLANKTSRHPKAIADLASLLSVTEMFRSMDQEFRNELCGLLEFLALPEGTVVFEEGDKIDFTYVILKGEVVLSRYNEARNISEDFAVKTTGQQFGTMSALHVSAAAAAAAAGAAGGSAAAAAAAAAGGGSTITADKKRTFSARCTQLTEFAIVTKVGYTRLIRNQLQKSLNTRLELLQGMAIMSNTTTQSILTRIAISCQDEVFSAGAMIVDPSAPPTRLFFIVEGQAKLLWVAESSGQLPPAIDRPLDAIGGGCSVSISGSIAGGGGGVSGDGSGMTSIMRDGRNIKRRQQSYVYELALLTRGDVVNGMVLHGRTSCFTVMAATNMKVMSLEVVGGLVALEQLFGREQAAMLRELVLLQAEVHRERAAHMVAIRQSAAHLKDHRQGGSTMPPLVSESPTTFLQHYVPKTPGAEAMPLTPLIGYAAAVADASLFVPGAVQHGDVMKLVTAAGQSVLDNLPSPPLPAITSPSSVRRMRISQEGSGPCFGGAAGGGGGNRSYSGSVPLGYQQTSKLPSREFQQLRDQPTSNQRKQSPPSLQAQQQQQQQLQPHHVTTVVAQPVAIPRTRMRVPSPGMARELGLEVPPPPPSQQTSASALDRVSSLGLLPDPAGGKSRNGRPRAPHRTQLGLPFAGNVAMLVLENHSDLVKVVSSVPSTLDCVATLRQVTNMPSNVSYCDDDGQCDDGSYGSSIAEVSNQSRDGVGHRVMVFAAQPVGPSAASTTSSPPAVSAIASSPQTPSLEGNSINIDSVHGTGLSSILTTPDTTGATDTGYGAAVTHGSDSAGRIATSPIRGTNSDASGGDGEGRLSPFSSMPAALNAIGYEEYFNRSNGGVSSDGADISSGIGGVSELSWRSRQPYAGTSSPLSHVEPLTLAASQSVLQMQNSMASLGGGGGGGGGGGNGSSGTPGASSGVFSAATTSQQPLITTPSGRSAAALLSTASIPLAAGQLHVPLTSVYRRMAPAPGAAGTAGAMLTPVLAATAVVQPAVSAETAKLCASRLTTVMSTGPMAEAAEPNAGSFGGATEAGNAAAGARACAATARLSSPSSLPPSTSSSFTRDYSYTRYGSPAPNCGDVIDASPLRSPPLMATPSQDNVVLLPRMVVYETALLDATAAVGSGSSPASPRSGAASGGGPTVRLASLGPVAASAAAAAASSTVPAGAGGGAATNGHSPTHILPALPGSAVAAVAAAAAVTGVGAGASPAAATAAGGGGGGGGMSSSPPGSPRLRPPPRMLRSMDASLPYQYGASRELLGYFSSGPRLAPEFDDAGMIFTGGIGGRPVRYGSPGGQRRGPGAGNGGSAAAARRIGGVSLRDLAGVNGIYRDENRNPMGRNAASQRAQEGPDLPLELDADAPPLQNRKLSEPSLDDLKYILTRWSKRWSQERNLVGCPVIGGPGLESCTSVSEPGSPLRQTATNDLLRYGYTSDDLYRMAKEQHQQQQQQLQQQQHQNHDVVGVGAFKRPLTQLDLFGLPYIGGTPRVVDRRPDPISSGVGGVGGVGGVHSSQLNERSVSSNRRAKLQG